MQFNITFDPQMFAAKTFGCPEGIAALDAARAKLPSVGLEDVTPIDGDRKIRVQVSESLARRSGKFQHKNTICVQFPNRTDDPYRTLKVGQFSEGRVSEGRVPEGRVSEGRVSEGRLTVQWHYDPARLLATWEAQGYPGILAYPV
jgi:hypothetical protein